VDVSFARDATVCKYLVPEGYPDQPRKGDPVPVPDALPAGTTLYLGSVDVKNGALVSAGSRTLAVVARGASLPEAEASCESVLREMRGPFFHRADVGTAGLIGRRVEHMRSLRAAANAGRSA
jgi:phosphoribosylamine-glycine ligase